MTYSRKYIWGMQAIFFKKGKRGKKCLKWEKKDRIFENLGKSVQNLNFFGKKDKELQVIFDKLLEKALL